MVVSKQYIVALQKLYLNLEQITFIGGILRSLRPTIARLTYDLFYPEQRRYWQERIELVQASEDNLKIPRVPDAGTIKSGLLIMHNGIRVDPGSYYGEGNRQLLVTNRGVHEPQEEYVFQEVIKYLPEEATMMELGSYWSFYSMWFHQAVKHPQCFMVEPSEHNIKFGQNNFDINQMKGNFIRGYISDKSGQDPDGTPIVCVDDLIRDYQIKHLHILHSDIQGFELEMLKGAKKAFAQEMIDYVFISTHSNEIHQQCLLQLHEYGYKIIVESDLDESFSVDGLIVGCQKSIQQPGVLEISRRNHK
jgi:hypothetical protein